MTQGIGSLDVNPQTGGVSRAGSLPGCGMPVGSLVPYLNKRGKTPRKDKTTNSTSWGEGDGRPRGPMTWADPRWNSKGEGHHLAPY